MQQNSARKPYNHCRYAGNIGDVWKHYILIETLKKLTATPRECFHYFETHGGPGYARLGALGDWQRGIGQFMGAALKISEHEYFQLVLPPMCKNFLYKGSWVLAAEFLRARSIKSLRLSIHEVNACTLKMAQSAIRKSQLKDIARLEPKDGFKCLNSLKSVDFVLIDPPYRSSDGTADDWELVYAALDRAMTLNTRWMIWYPIFRRTEPDELIARSGSQAFELTWAPEAPGWVMKGCGMLVDPRTAQELCTENSDLLELAAQLKGIMTVRDGATAQANHPLQDNEAALISTRPSERVTVDIASKIAVENPNFASK